MLNSKLLATALLVLLPGMALAMGCNRDYRASSCADGFTWDDQSLICVEVASS